MSMMEGEFSRKDDMHARVAGPLHQGLARMVVTMHAHLYDGGTLAQHFLAGAATENTPRSA